MKNIYIFVYFMIMTGFCLANEGCLDESVFLDTSIFKISIEKTEADEWEHFGTKGNRERKPTEYFLRLENTSDVELSGLRLEVCMYGETFGSHSFLSGSADYVSVNSYDMKIRSVKPFSVREVELGRGSCIRDSEGNFVCMHKGVRVKIFLPLSDGREFVREVRVPKTLLEKEYVWKDPGTGRYNSLKKEEPFMDTSAFRISVKETETDWVYDPGGANRTINRTSRKTGYTLRLENTSDARFTGVKADYRIYRLCQGNGEGYVVSDFRSMPIGPIQPATTNLFHLEEATSYSNRQYHVSEEVLGARIRVCLTLSSGEEVIREIRVPEELPELICPWKEFSEERIRTFNSLEKGKPFLSPELLKFSIDKVDGDWVSAPRIPEDRMEKSSRFIIRIENTNSVVFRDLRMDYCVYAVRQTRSKDSCFVYPDSTHIRTIDSGATSQVVIECPVSVKTPSLGYGREVSAGCFRVYLLLSDGREVMREIRFPEAFSEEKYPWKSPKEDGLPHVIPLSK